ncbi:MAG: hypothetical protein GF364_02595 [Candidatus Lokiarchaeota archaeon]|nr:hypothetical protein [Candidatus Lokiarchaeota archaeon]
MQKKIKTILQNIESQKKALIDLYEKMGKDYQINNIIDNINKVSTSKPFKESIKHKYAHLLNILSLIVSKCPTNLHRIKSQVRRYYSRRKERLEKMPEHLIDLIDKLPSSSPSSSKIIPLAATKHIEPVKDAKKAPNLIASTAHLHNEIVNLYLDKTYRCIQELFDPSTAKVNIKSAKDAAPIMQLLGFINAYTGTSHSPYRNLMKSAIDKLKPTVISGIGFEAFSTQMENIYSRQNYAAYSRMLHILNSNIDRQILLWSILATLKDFSKQQSKKQQNIVKRFLFQQSIPSHTEFIQGIKDRYFKIAVHLHAIGREILSSSKTYEDFMTNLSKSKKSYLKAAKRKLGNAKLAQASYKRYKRFEEIGKTINKAYIANALKQARNLCFKAITRGVAQSVSPSVKYNEMKERFTFQGLSQTQIEILHVLGDTPSRMRSRLISEHENISNKNTNKKTWQLMKKHFKGNAAVSLATKQDFEQIVNTLYTTLDQKWSDFLNKKETRLDYLNEHKPEFKSNIIVFDTDQKEDDKASFYRYKSNHNKITPIELKCIARKIKSSQNYDGKKLDLENILNKTYGVAEFSSNRLSPIPVKQQDKSTKNNKINGGTNTVVKEFVPKKQQLIVKSKKKIYFNVPYTDGLISTPKRPDKNGKFSSWDVGMRTSAVGIVAEKKNKCIHPKQSFYIDEGPVAFAGKTYDDICADLSLPKNLREKVCELIQCTEKNTLAKKVKAMKLDNLLENAKITDKISANYTPANMSSNYPNRTRVFRDRGSKTRLGMLFNHLATLQNSSGHLAVLQQLVNQACIPIRNKDNQREAMKAEKVLYVLLYRICGAYLVTMNRTKKRGNNNKKYRRIQRLYKVLKKRVTCDFNRMKRKNRSSTVVAEKLLAKSTRKSPLSSVYLNISKHSQNKVDRRSRFISHNTAVRITRIGERYKTTTDGFEKLSWSAMKGFTHAQIVSRMKDLAVVKGRRVAKVNASHTSSEYYKDNLSLKSKPRHHVKGYMIRRYDKANKSYYMEFLPIQRGNMAAISENGSWIDFKHRDKAASIAVGARLCNKGV